MRSRTIAALIVLACLIVPAAFASAGSSAELAKAALEAAGRTNGLCLDIGCGREGAADLAAELAAGGEMLVHGLALDEAAATRARAAIASRGLLGRAMVECVPARPLPYPKNFANVVLVEDLPALTKLGLTREDLLAVVAPGGVLLVREGDGWAKTAREFPRTLAPWTHPAGDPGGTRVSADRAVEFPVGVRWQDGLPMNVTAWAAVRSYVIDRGRCFSVGTTELENLGPAVNVGRKADEYLTARDAFTGLPLWKVNLGSQNNGAALSSMNPAAVVVSGDRVWACCGGKLTCFAAADGKVLRTYAVKYPTVRLLLADGVLVATGWKDKQVSGEKEFASAGGLWAPWVAKDDAGAVEAFDVETGENLWSQDFASQDMLEADGNVYLLEQTGRPATAQTVVAVDLRTGREKWRVSHEKIAPDLGLHLSAAGEGVVLVVAMRDKKLLALAAETGKLAWEASGQIKTTTPIREGEVWTGSKRINVRTGEVIGPLAPRMNDGMCTPVNLVGSFVLFSRGSTYATITQSGAKMSAAKHSGSRGACVQGLVPANGMLFSAQNNCLCAPAQLSGFFALAPCGALPTAEAFAAPREVQKGPAFGKVAAAAPAATDWPTLLGSAERTAVGASPVPGGLKVLWTRQAAPARTGPLARVWEAALTDPVTAPVVAGGRVYAAACEAGQMVAMNLGDGKELWRFDAGGRIDTPPTITAGLCVFGCHDGYIYAVAATDGKLAWRVRAAPAERRVVAFGAVESAWPAIGSVLANEGAIFATAGRSTDDDGGVAVLALSPADGHTLWATQLGDGIARRNDVLRMEDGKLAIHQVRIDPADGTFVAPKLGLKERDSLGGLLDNMWTRIGARRSGQRRFGMLKADLYARTDATLYGCSAGACFGISVDKTAPPAATPAPATAPAAGNPEPKPGDGDYLFREKFPAGQLATAIALSGESLVLAGRTWTKTDAPAGFLRVVAAGTGQTTLTLPLTSPVVYNGLALAGGRVVVSLADGSVVCLGQADE